MDYSKVVRYGIEHPPYLGNILYRIDHINPSWEFILQRYSNAVYVNNYILIESDFDLFRQDDTTPTRLSGSKSQIIELWQTIFSIKEDYIERFSPDAILHFIDPDYATFSKRLRMYQQYLNAPGYEYLIGSNTFYLVKSAAKNKLETSLFGTM